MLRLPRINPLQSFTAFPLKEGKTIRDIPALFRAPWLEAGRKNFEEKLKNIPFDLYVRFSTGATGEPDDFFDKSWKARRVGCVEIDKALGGMFRCKRSAEEDLYDHFMLGAPINPKTTETVKLLRKVAPVGVHFHHTGEGQLFGNEGEKRGDPQKVQPITPFVLMHNVYEGFPSYIKLASPAGRSRIGIHSLVTGQVDTTAGRLGALIDYENAMADLFAAYVLVRKIKYPDVDAKGQELKPLLKQHFDAIIRVTNTIPIFMTDTNI